MRKRRERQLYLICTNDHLETAFFCGTAWECAQVLGLASAKVVQCAVTKKTQVFDRFAHIERVPGDKA
jgi:hypothetical protein